jgi:hypothetical protein
MNPSRADVDFTPEHGKFFLAEALFDRYKYQIRCPSCPGTREGQGFIRDSAGNKDVQNKKRRQYKCQQSNKR